MRGAEDPADQVPQAASAATSFRLTADSRNWYVDRLRNGRISYRLVFNWPQDAREAYRLATR